VAIDLFAQINNAVIDLQSSQHQTFEQPLKKLARLLRDPALDASNNELISGLDLEAFLEASERSGGGMGNHKLAWPESDDDKQRLGLTLLLIEKLAEDPKYAINFGHHYFSSGSRKLISGVHGFTGQIIAPFVRDYKVYVESQGEVKPQLKISKSNKVFIVHGHDEAALQGLARFLEKLGLEAIILREQPDRGQTIIEKFEHSADVGFAVILLTPDDVGGSIKADVSDARARQNVIFELGFFAGKLGRGRVCLLRKGQVEIPSDLFGVIYTDMDSAEAWKMKLVRELKAAQLDFDATKFW
jgi:hypothetical protein